MLCGTALIGLLHGCSASQQPAPQPASQPPAQEASPAAADKQVLVNSHDDPVVVDNEHVGVSRESKPKTPKHIQNDEWSVHEIDFFSHIQYWARDKGNTEHGPKTIAVGNNVKAFQFDLVEDKETETGPRGRSFEIRLYSAGGAHDEVRVESKTADLKFKDQGTDLKDQTKKLRIGQIRYGGNKFICFAETGEPLERECRTWTKLPQKIRVELCANEQCEQISDVHVPAPR